MTRRIGAPLPSGEFSSEPQIAWNQILIQKAIGPATPTPEAFAARFDRCFRHVFRYVRGRVEDRQRHRQIVTEVLTGSLDLFLTAYTEREEYERLTASADRLLAL